MKMTPFMHVLLLLPATAMTATCSPTSSTSCEEENEMTGLLQVNTKNGNVAANAGALQVKVCGFKSSGGGDPVAEVAPVCVDGFNAGMAEGCSPDAYMMMIIYNKGKDKAYCAYQGGWALSTYAAKGCNASNFFNQPGVNGPLFWDGAPKNVVTNFKNDVLKGFESMKQDTSGKFSCDGGCKWTGESSGPWISITNSGGTIPTGKVGRGEQQTFSWAASNGYVGVSRYSGSGSIESMTLKNEEGGRTGLSEQSGSMDTCNSIVRDWPITGVSACTQDKDVFAPVTGDAVTVNC